MSTPYCPELHPSLAEFRDFEAYVSSVRAQHPDAGMVKVVAPPQWVPRKDQYRSAHFMVNHPVRQEVYGTAGVYELLLVSQRAQTLQEYRNYAERLPSPPETLSVEQMEELFWRNVRYNSPVYGADSDVETLFDPGVPWNLGELQSALTRGLGGVRLKGVVTPYVYVGAWKTMFAWHCEDLDLPAINYLHFGKPKFWYAIHPADAHRFETIATSHFPTEHASCSEFLRHKCTLISPKLLRANNIRITKAVQRPREFILVFEHVYHAGFNFGFNAAEAVNFALPEWVAYGRKAKVCRCESDNVAISIDRFEANLAQSPQKRAAAQARQKPKKRSRRQ